MHPLAVDKGDNIVECCDNRAGHLRRHRHGHGVVNQVAPPLFYFERYDDTGMHDLPVGRKELLHQEIRRLAHGARYLAPNDVHRNRALTERMRKIRGIDPKTCADKACDRGFKSNTYHVSEQMEFFCSGCESTTLQIAKRD